MQRTARNLVALMIAMCVRGTFKEEDVLISTSVKDIEDTDLLCNTLNAQAGRFLYSDQHLRYALLRAQAAINYFVDEFTKLQESTDNIDQNKEGC